MELTGKDIEWIARGLAAETIRAYMRDGKGLVTVIHRVGVNPYTGSLTYGSNAMAIVGNAPAIVVDENLSADGTRYWFAHMLAHYLAATERVCGAEPLRPSGRVECGDGSRENGGVESLADLFARELCRAGRCAALARHLPGFSSPNSFRYNGIVHKEQGKEPK